ncbi:MAG: hypothetical protein J7J75_04105 [Euryarchaeota archaeon]|nr:hypothetical protein [Euryarchaeota archaeon]
MEVRERVLEKIRGHLRKIYLYGLTSNIIDSGFVVSFYISSNKLVLSIDQRVLSMRVVTSQHIRALEEGLMEIIATFGLKGIRIEDIRGKVLLDKTF